MKKRNVVNGFLALLEGLLSGGCFYLAKRDREPLNLAAGCIWLTLSVFHGLMSFWEEDHILLVEEEDYE